jgi:hypothetical protein
MFDLNSLSKLTDEIPEDLKEKLKDAALEKLGLSKSESNASPEASAAPAADADDQPQSDDSSDAQGNDDSGQ